MSKKEVTITFKCTEDKRLIIKQLAEKKAHGVISRYIISLIDADIQGTKLEPKPTDENSAHVIENLAGTWMPAYSQKIAAAIKGRDQGELLADFLLSLALSPPGGENATRMGTIGIDRSASTLAKAPKAK